MNRSAPVKSSRPTVASSRPTTAAMSALSRAAAADGRDEQDAEQRERGVLGRAEVEREPGDERRDQRQRDDREGAADERADGGDAERRAGPALPGEGVAVEDGDHRRRLAGQAQQDRGDGAAVLGAVEDAGQHDDRGDRLEAEGERQQDRDGGGRAEPGQHADEHADDDADEAVQQVRRFEDDGEAVEHRGQASNGPPIVRLRTGAGWSRRARRRTAGRTRRRRPRLMTIEVRQLRGRGSAARRTPAAAVGISKPIVPIDGDERRPCVATAASTSRPVRVNRSASSVCRARAASTSPSTTSTALTRTGQVPGPGADGAAHAQAQRCRRTAAPPRTTTSAGDDEVRHRARGGGRSGSPGVVRGPAGSSVGVAHVTCRSS